jgi:nicotinate-nucleotide adenylyltransferase
MATFKLIGILGGTFDPIHLGHLHLAKTILQQTYLQQIKLVPCYQSPHRDQPLVSSKHRLEMIRLATASNPFLQVDSCELKKPRASYTVNTLQQMHKQLPEGFALCLIMGADAFQQFTLWHEWQEILQLCNLIVATRPGVDTSCKKLPKDFPATVVTHPIRLHKKPAGLIWFTDIKPLNISATTIRHFIKNGKDVSAFLPEPVWHYIEKHKLYQ